MVIDPFFCFFYSKLQREYTNHGKIVHISEALRIGKQFTQTAAVQLNDIWSIVSQLVLLSSGMNSMNSWHELIQLFSPIESVENEMGIQLFEFLLAKFGKMEN